MSTFLVTDPTSGLKLKLTGDSPPSNEELDEIFAEKLAELNPQKTLTTDQQAPAPGMQVTDVAQLQGEPGFLETELGQSAGGLVGGLKGAIEATRATSSLPIPPLARGALIAGGGALGAAGGGATGELGQQAFQLATDSELAPENIREGVTRAAEAGGEEAVFDLLGGAIFKAGSSVYRGAIRPMARESAGLIKEILEKGGSNATLGQLTDNAMVRGIERLTRGAILGGSKFEKLDLAQDAAVANFSKDYAEIYTGQAIENLTPEATGKFFVNVIEQGKSAHKAAAGELYSKLDEFVKNVPVERLDVVKTPLPGSAVVGKKGGVDLGGFTRETVRTAEEVLPVNISSVSSNADKLLSSLEKISGIGATEEGSKLLSQLSNLPPKLSFLEAHELRSNLIAIKGNVSFKNTDSIANKNIATALQQVDNAMDSAGKALDPKGLAQYRHISKFWKFGKKNFDNDMIRSLIKNEETPEKIGAALFRPGSVSLAKAARKAVKSAAALDKSIDFSTTWRRVQGGFLERMLPASADDVASAGFLKLHGNRKLQETLKATFTKEQQQGMNKLSKAMSDLVEARGAKGNISARQLASAGQVGAAISGVAGGIAMGPAMVFVALPEVFAQIATRPALTNLFVSWTKSKPGTTAYRTAALKLATATGLSIDDLLTPDEQNVGKTADKDIQGLSLKGL